MKKFEELQIKQIHTLKRPTVYFYLKTNGFSENHIKHLRSASGNMLLNGAPATMRDKISIGDTLCICNDFNTATTLPKTQQNLDVLFEDDDFLIVNKPHNLTCTPTKSHYLDNLGAEICTYMQNKDKDYTLRILNRLDREAAGIVIAPKNLIAYSSIQPNKTYHAICHGKPKPQIVDAPIQTITHNGINQMKRVVSPDGKPAITHIKPIKTIKLPNNQEVSLIEIKIETGRTHQIRVHLSHIGHPLVFDTLYGNSEKDKPLLQFLQNTQNLNLGTALQQNCAKLLLKTITFTHHKTNQNITINAPYPESWNFII